jgi:hypothetical protein
MANEEHLAILKQGVEVWNKWREEHRGVPDLAGANLEGAKLSQANLSGANLSGANLIKAIFFKADLSNTDLGGANLSITDLGGANLSITDLSGANLSRTDLRRAILYMANLSQANLSGANLSGAYLSRANLSRADLYEANLYGVNLSRADLSGAIIGYTSFGGVDLTDVRNLETVKHSGPSTIGIDTIYNSKGKILESFLRGCGVPDIFIEYLPSLSQQPIQFYSCFISYSSQDTAFAERLHADLQTKGVRCWFAPEDMKIGDKIRPTIDQSIRIHDKLLLVLSKHSMASQWVEHEVEHALDLEIERGEVVLFPVRLDQTVVDSKVGWAAKIRRERHIGDFSQWKDRDSYQKAFDRYC